jgi:hypothetical protein
MDSDGQRQRAPRAKDREKFELAVEVIVCNLVALTLGNTDLPLAYVRANHASRLSQVYGKPFNRAVALMEDDGLVITEVGYRHRSSTRYRASSTMTRTPVLMLPVVNDWNALSLNDYEHVIVLNTDGDEGKANSLPPSRRWLSEMEDINKHLHRANIEIDGAAHVASWHSTITARLVSPHHRQLRRVFNVTYEQGGRLFGGSWQTLPREDRKHIRIDGALVVNVDFTAMHLRLAYAEAGCDPQGDDLYDLTGTDHLRPDWQTLREGRKRLVSVMFMSKRKLTQWPGMTPREREDIKSPFGRSAKVKDEVAAIRERHKAIAEWFECGRGLRLQRTESDILVAVLLKLNALGITALPIHDAVLVARSHGETAKRIMEAESRKVTGAKIPVKVSNV